MEGVAEDFKGGETLALKGCGLEEVGEVEAVLVGDGAVEVGPDYEAVEVAYDEEGRAGKGVAVLL